MKHFKWVVLSIAFCAVMLGGCQQSQMNEQAQASPGPHYLETLSDLQWELEGSVEEIVRISRVVLQDMGSSRLSEATDRTSARLGQITVAGTMLDIRIVAITADTCRLQLLVRYDQRDLSPELAQIQDEMVRQKLLDALGDRILSGGS